MAGLAILGLTFALGVLVGRQWARQGQALASVQPEKKPAPAGRRAGPAEAGPGQPRELQGQLTFYRTLTAPMTPPVPQAKARPDERGKAENKPRVETLDKPRVEPLDRPKAEERAKASPPAGGAPAPEASVTGGAAPAGGSAGWSVQVGAFSSRIQAASVQRALQEAGFDAYLVATSPEAGPVRYRVRVGTFKARAEAERLAERLRAERSLATFVTN